MTGLPHVRPPDLRANGFRADQASLLALLVEHVKDYAIFMLDPDGTVMTWNEGAARIKGYSAEEIIGKPFSVFYADEAVERGHPQEILRRALVDGRCEDEGWRMRKDGTRFWASVVVTALRSEPDGQLLGFAKVTRDLTERKHLEDERIARLAREVHERDAFLSIAAHELKTPLTSAKAALQLVMRRAQANRPDTSVGHSLAIVERQIEKLALLVTRLLESGRIDADKVALDREPTDLKRLVDEIAETLAESTDRRIDVTGSSPLIATVDRLRLEQVLVNLIDNALKHSPAASAVEVTLARSDNGVIEIAVRDHGVGVPLGQRDRLGERYFQAHHDRSGMGLGLYISRVIAEQHGGTLRADFPSDGGSRFVVSLSDSTS